MAGASQKLSDVAARYIGAAAQHPGQRRDIFRRAANTFLGLAGSPKNAKLAERLQLYAQEFARAAERPATIPDFTDLLNETAQAYSEIGDPNSDIDLVARRRDIHEQRSTTLGRISIAPRSFNEDTAFGRVLKLKYQPTEEDTRNSIVQSDTASQWQGDKVEAQSLTVQVGVIRPAESPPRAISDPVPGARPYGQVSFGSDGTVTTILFDVGRGVRFTVACNFITVLLGMDPPPAAETLNVPVTAGVSLGMFAAPSLAPVFRTVYLDSLADTAFSDVMAIPPGAVQLYTPMCSRAAGTTTIELFDVSQTVLAGKLLLTNGVPVQPIPLPNDAVFFRVQNNSGGFAAYRFPFQLSL